MNSYTWNNRTAFSNHSMISMVNGRLTFIDGSWIDLRTGEMSQEGGMASQATIVPPFPTREKRKNDDPEAAAEEKKKLEPKELSYSFSASQLAVAQVPKASVEVLPHEDSTSQITVTVIGPASLVEEITVEQIGPSVSVRGKDETITSILSIGAVRSFSFLSRVVQSFISGDTVIAGYGAELPSLKIQIKVPKKTPLSFSGEWRSVKIGDVEGPLNVDADGFHDLYAGKVTSATLAVSSSGGITVEEVNGEVFIDNSGTAKIRINGGTATKLKLDLSSSGGVHFDGVANNVVIDHSGYGSCYIREVMAKLLLDISSSGEMKIDSVDVTEMIVDHTGYGKVSISRGKAAILKLNLDSSGTFSYGGVVERLILDHSGYGDISFSNLESLATMLEVELSASGNFKYSGTCRSAKLSNDGYGNLYVRRVEGELLETELSSSGNIKLDSVVVNKFISDIDGYGDFRALDGKVQVLKVSLNSSGNFNFGGEAVDADLENDGYGDITIQKVSGRLSKDRNSSGNIKIIVDARQRS